MDRLLLSQIKIINTCAVDFNSSNATCVYFMVLPNTLYTDVSYTDSGGNLVRVNVTGPIVPLQIGFTIELAGLAENNADATRINLLGLTANNGLQISVTPQLLPNAGPGFNNIYSAGYTNVAFLSAERDSAFPTIPATTNIGSIHTSSAVINSIRLVDVAIANVTLDPGRATYIDRINTTNNQQAADSTFYNPVAGLVDIGGIEAAAMDSLVVNGAISAVTGNPYDTSVTNDIRSIINVKGRIGSIVGLRTSISGAVRADSIGSVRVANISGEITTRNSLQSMSINLPAQFKGFINCAGHLHLGFPMSDGALITGQIRAGRGISGSVRQLTLNREDFSDTIYIPQNFTGSLTNTNADAFIANIEVDGIAALSIFSAGDVNNIVANEFDGNFVVEAKGSVGNIDASSGSFEGHITAGQNIGNVKAVRSMLGTLIAGGNVGRIECVEGTVESLSVQAGGDIAGMYAYRGMLSTSVVAKGNLGDIEVPVAGLTLCYLRAANISDIRVRDGSLQNVSIISEGAVGNVSAFGSVQGFGIGDTSIVAQSSVGNITGNAHTGSGIRALKVECKFGGVGDVTGTSAGEFGQLAGDGIIDCNIVCLRQIGSITGTSAGGYGIRDSKFISSGGGIAGISASGWLDGMNNTTVVIFKNVDIVIGESKHTGSGIIDSSITSTNGTIGIVNATGGAVEGSGMSSVRLQATNEQLGGIGPVSATCGANGQHGLNAVTIHGTSIESVSVLAKSGPEGNGLTDCDIRAFKGSLGQLSVIVNSTAGKGMLNTKVQASDDIEGVSVQTYNNNGIEACVFTSRGDYGDIRVETSKAGYGIVDSTFTASGRIRFLPTDEEMPKGKFANITVTAGGTTAEFGGIVRSQFVAIQGYGVIDVKSKGGPCILESQFGADTDSDDTGAIAGILIANAGRQRQASSGIVASTFTATNIGLDSGIVVDIQTVEGGNGISDNSLFLARTAVYDGRGNYNNTGSVGTITVSNASNTGDGIANSNIIAGAAGQVGDVNVTVTGGRAIADSTISAILIDPDQSVFTSTVGNVQIRAGRAQGATIVPAGIVNSFVVSAGGIGNVSVDSVGTGITNSVFVGDFFFTQPILAQTTGTFGTIGNIGNIVVNVPGRFGSCITSSIFYGSSLGNIVARLVDDAARGLNAIAASTFLARTGSIASVTATHSYSAPPYPPNTGYAILNSLFAALTAIGPIFIQGRTLNAVFIVVGTNVVLVRSKGGLDDSAIAVSTMRGTTPELDDKSTFKNASALQLVREAAMLVRIQSDALAAEIKASASADLQQRDALSLRELPMPNLGPVVMNVTDTSELTLQSLQGAIAPIVVTVYSTQGNVLPPIDVTLIVQAQVVQSLNVEASTAGQFTLNASNTLSIESISNKGDKYPIRIVAPQTTAIGDVTSQSDVSLSAASIMSLGSVLVENNGVLNVDTGFGNLLQFTGLTCGFLRGNRPHSNVVIGTPRATGTQCGQIVVATSAQSLITFAFAEFVSSPNALIGGVPVTAATGKGTTRDGLRLVTAPYNPCVFSQEVSACRAPGPKPRPDPCKKNNAKKCKKNTKCKRT